jgi:polyhydroxybutyrate depolymerase
MPPLAASLHSPSATRASVWRRVLHRPLRAAALAGLVGASGMTLGGFGAGPASGAVKSGSEKAVVPYGAPIKTAVTAVGRGTNGTVMVSGVPRTYRLYVPTSLPRNTSVPLLVALHGGLGSGPQFEEQTGFDGLAQANRFIVVYPNGTPIRPGSKELVWNAGACCSVAAQNQENINDVGFIAALITQLESRYTIDTKRVFAAGHSNGAMLGERLACQLSNQIVAIGVQSGALMVNQCKPAQPVATLEIHGTADQNVPINGGIGSKSLNGVDYPPAVHGLQLLAAGDSCPSASTSSKDPMNPAVHFEVWQPCAAGTVVEWAKVTGANHAWMGHPASPVTQRFTGGAPYLGFDSSAAIWSFLAAHPRP